MRRIFFWAAGVIFLTASLHAQVAPELDTYIESARKQWNVPGLAVTIVRDGKLVAAKGYGIRRHGSPELVDEHTMFDIASLSKSFTAAAIATLVDEGKMRWDDPVRRWLPQVEFVDPYRTSSVTIRDLLAHRVGVEQGNFAMRFTNYDTAEVLRRMRYLKERDPIRTSMIYSNIGYTAAAEAAAAAAKMPFADLVRTRLVEPLGMRETTVGVPHTLAANYAWSHARIDDKVTPIRTKKLMNILGANAVNSTAHDLAKWLLFSLGDGTWEGKRIVSAEAMSEMQSPHNIIATTPQMRAARGVQHFAGYGLGWQVMDFRGRKMIWHSGSADGMPVYMALLPDDKIGVAVLTNSWEAGTLHGALASRILDTLLGNPPRDWAQEAYASGARAVERLKAERAAMEKARIPNTKPSRPLEAYAGTYVDTLHGDLVITHKAGRLHFVFGGGETATLEHWHHDVFRLRWTDPANDWADTLVAFGLDVNAAPNRLEMTLGRDRIVGVR
jgi:CubicO group peptidase (beta-lactamase class C family)